MVVTSERKDKIIAFSATVLIHIALLLLFFYILLRTPLPPFPGNQGIGIEVDFGSSGWNIGDNSVESSETKTPQADNTRSNEASEAVLTNDAENESITIRKVKKPKEKDTHIEKPVETKPVEEKPSSELADAIAKFKTNKNKGTGGGTTEGPGGSGSGTGTGTGPGDGGDGGSGANYNLRGRLLLKKPEIVDDSQEEGKVIVEIIVDETGKVIRATPGARGSTTTNAVLYAKARQAAFGAKFSVSEIKEQKGTITFKFILN